MKSLFPSAILLIFFLGQENIYDIDIQLVSSGQPIGMSSFAGKKIVIATIRAANPDTAQLRFFDSLQTADQSLVVIAVPVIDSSGVGNDRFIARLQNSLSLDFIITRSARVTKNAGNGQLSLFRWLTNATGNGHFDTDVRAPGQLFIISKNGILYSVLERNTPARVLFRTLSQEPTK
jgi:glutathione peroxidase-family protein